MRVNGLSLNRPRGQDKRGPLPAKRGECTPAQSEAPSTYNPDASLHALESRLAEGWRRVEARMESEEGTAFEYLPRGGPCGERILSPDGRSAGIIDEILVCNQSRGRCVSAVCLLGRAEEVRFPLSDIPRCEDVGSARQRKARPLKADTTFVTVPSNHAHKDCCRGRFLTLMLMFNMLRNDTVGE